MKATKEIAMARYELFNEAAEHIGMDVTDDETELEQVPFVQRSLRRSADRWHKIATEREQKGQ